MSIMMCKVPNPYFEKQPCTFNGCLSSIGRIYWRWFDGTTPDSNDGLCVQKKASEKITLSQSRSKFSWETIFFSSCFFVWTI